MWVVSGSYRIKPGKREEFVQNVLDLQILDKILGEEGNVGYQYYYPAGSADDVFFVEQWENEAAWKKHLEAPHVTHDLKALKDQYQTGFQPGLLGELTAP